MPDDNRIQTWRERMPIVAKMINSAFNGDVEDKNEHVCFALVVCKPDGRIACIKNIPDHAMIAAFLHIIAEKAISPTDDDDDEQAVGHA